MNKAESKQLKEDIIHVYNLQLSDLYKKYKEVPSGELRLIYLDTIHKHIISKTISEINKKTSQKHTLDKILRKIEEVKTEVKTEGKADKGDKIDKGEDYEATKEELFIDI